MCVACQRAFQKAREVKTTVGFEYGGIAQASRNHSFYFSFKKNSSVSSNEHKAVALDALKSLCTAYLNDEISDEFELKEHCGPVSGEGNFFLF